MKLIKIAGPAVQESPVAQSVSLLHPPSPSCVINDTSSPISKWPRTGSELGIIYNFNFKNLNLAFSTTAVLSRQFSRCWRFAALVRKQGGKHSNIHKMILVLKNVSQRNAFSKKSKLFNICHPSPNWWPLAEWCYRGNRRADEGSWRKEGQGRGE